jgi:hypothetical protein
VRSTNAWQAESASHTRAQTHRHGHKQTNKHTHTQTHTHPRRTCPHSAAQCSGSRWTVLYVTVNTYTLCLVHGGWWKVVETGCCILAWVAPLTSRPTTRTTRTSAPRPPSEHGGRSDSGVCAEEAHVDRMSSLHLETVTVMRHHHYHATNWGGRQGQGQHLCAGRRHGETQVVIISLLLMLMTHRASVWPWAYSAVAGRRRKVLRSECQPVCARRRPGRQKRICYDDNHADDDDAVGNNNDNDDDNSDKPHTSVNPTLSTTETTNRELQEPSGAAVAAADAMARTPVDCRRWSSQFPHS